MSTLAHLDFDEIEVRIVLIQEVPRKPEFQAKRDRNQKIYQLDVKCPHCPNSYEVTRSKIPFALIRTSDRKETLACRTNCVRNATPATFSEILNYLELTEQ